MLELGAVVRDLAARAVGTSLTIREQELHDRRRRQLAAECAHRSGSTPRKQPPMSTNRPHAQRTDPAPHHQPLNEACSRTRRAPAPAR